MKIKSWEIGHQQSNGVVLLFLFFLIPYTSLSIAARQIQHFIRWLHLVFLDINVWLLLLYTGYCWANESNNTNKEWKKWEKVMFIWRMSWDIIKNAYLM